MSSFAYPVPSLYKNDPGRQAATTILTSQLTGVYSSYTPTWTSTGTLPVLGNGTIVGSFLQLGKLTVGSITLTIGSTSTFGTGAYLLSLPFAASGATNAPLGIVDYTDASSGSVYTASAGLFTSTTFAIYLANAAGPASASVPVATAASDTFLVNFFYQAA